MRDRFRRLRVLVLVAGVAPLAALAEVQVVTSGPVELRFTFPGARGRAESITLDRFLLNGQPVTAANQLQVRQLAAGVNEVTAQSTAAGDWEFDLADQSSYYGFGERYDRLNHAHSIVLNGSRDASDAKGLSTYQPVPFYMSLSGYGLWVDTFSETSFDSM